jgi:hypothetical protein
MKEFMPWWGMAAMESMRGLAILVVDNSQSLAEATKILI